MSRKMNKFEKSVRQEKMRENPKSPSFSSTLLDEIYREIDGDDEFKSSKEELAKKNSSINNVGDRANARNSIENEDMASFRRACLIEKWMEKKVSEKLLARRGLLYPEFDHKLMLENDPLFFSTGSNSSDSSFGGFSSSETESLGAVKSKISPRFTAPMPKPVRTSVQTRDLAHFALYHEQSEVYLFDDYRRTNHQTNKTEGLIKSKTRALKIYENLKKMKQPISPGGRITSFINNLFTNGNPKKIKKFKSNENGRNDIESKTQASSTCSSASSFSRFYLSKNSTNTLEKVNNAKKRNEDVRNCTHKSLSNEDFERLQIPMSQQRNEDQPKLRPSDQKNCKKNDFVARNVGDEDIDDEDYEDDADSDSSSDLFELDHLALFENDTFCNDLPVYETTHLGTNRAIASGFIR